LALLLGAVGASAFWLPDVAIHAIARYNFDSDHAWFVTFASPVALLLVYFAFRSRILSTGYLHCGKAMLAGVWLAGGLFMLTAASFTGGGFASLDKESLLLLACTPLPPVTILMATYDGSLFALLLVTIGAVAVGNACSSRQ
jgi:hypothetical protein